MKNFQPGSSGMKNSKFSKRKISGKTKNVPQVVDNNSEEDSDESDSESDSSGGHIGAFRGNGTVDDEGDEVETGSDEDQEFEDEDDSECDEGSGSADDDSGSDDSAEDDANADEVEEEDGDEFREHKKSLSKLKDTDPDFYQFLQENDKKLLQFDVSDSDDEEEEDKCHKPPAELEVDSEESDFESDTKPKRDERVVTLALVKKWRKDLEEPTVESLSIVVKGFQAALDRVTGEQTSELKVDGSSVFNAIVELCVMDLRPAIVKFLKLPAGTIKQPEKSKRWIKIRNLLQTYFTYLFKLASGVTSTNIVSVILKHLHGICPFLVPFSKQSRQCLHLLARLWSSAEETVRVIAYLCILRLTTSALSSHKKLLNESLKVLYLAYVKTTRFVSVSTMAGINFMRRSLADLFTVNPSLSYQHAFLYIRQLAIHLRNAITMKKKEKFQTVYNWQYIQSLQLWVELLCTKREALQPLAYPLISIIIGCIKLIPTAQYIPLRFHCLNMLIKLQRETDIFIPIFPYITECFSIVNLNAAVKKASIKPFDFSCVLRLSKAAMTESAYTEAVIEGTCQLLIDTAYNHHCSIAYPDLVVPVVVQLKSVIKDIKAQKYATKLKQVLTKLEENSKFLNAERNKVSASLSDTDKIKAFEANLRQRGTPLAKHWDQWQKSRIIHTKKEEKDEIDEISDFKLPTIRKDLKRKPSAGPAVLFPSDDESEPDISTLLCRETTPEPEKKKRKETKSKVALDSSVKEESGSDEDDDKEDILQAFNLKSF